MADSATASGSEATGHETPNQRQARLRREKRAKKMADEGEDRLARIKALNGGIAPADDVLNGPSSGPTVDDPDEVDISSMNTRSGAQARSDVSSSPNDNPLAAAMLQMQQEQARAGGQSELGGNMDDDPTIRMMQQMMGMMGGPNQQDPNAPPPELPPMLKAMLGGAANAGQEQEQPATRSVHLWRIIHGVFALNLALYIALSSTFNGSKLARSHYEYGRSEGYGFGRQLFLLFCTGELILQSSRYFLEKGQLQGTGMLAQIANSGVVPEPWAGYVRSIGRYIGFAQTVFADLMVIVFVFGTLAWWQGLAVV